MKINGFTAFLVFQMCAVLIVISLAVFRPRPWSAARWTGLGIAVPAAVLLFVARWQLGKSFSSPPRLVSLSPRGCTENSQSHLRVQRLNAHRHSDRAAKAV